MVLGERIERLEVERARLLVELERQRDRSRRLLAEQGRLRRLLADHSVDPDTGLASSPDEILLARAFSEPAAPPSESSSRQPAKSI